jgi:short-subunit dehydrogenase
MRDLKDMVVVITGASAGIGAVLARGLHARGAKLALAARRGDRLEALNAELGGSHLAITADVAKTDDCRRIIDEAVARFGRIDTLVANAGYGRYLPVHEMPPQAVRDMFATNVFGTTDCIHAAMPRLLANEERNGWRGQVMIVSSAAARRGVPYLGVYSGTKAAQHLIAEAMRVELRPQAIAVTSVHPVMTTTDFGSVAEASGEIRLPRGNEWMTQTVEHVARRMLRAIEKPCAEVWPQRPTRWALGLGALFPRLIDVGMARYRDKILAYNKSPRS